jgi:hypothetical protein
MLFSVCEQGVLKGAPFLGIGMVVNENSHETT